MIEVLILDRHGSAIPQRDGVVRLEEANHYEVRFPGTRGARAWMGARLLRESGSGGFAIDSEHVVGFNQLRVQWDDETRVWPVEIRPRADKLADSSWLAMLTELEAWLPGTTVGQRGARHGQVGDKGTTNPSFIAEALTPLIPVLERAVRIVLEDPRQRAQSRWRDVPIRSARRVDRETLGWVSRHPDVGAWLDPWRAAELSGAEPTLPQRHTIDTVDHPANRYLSWLLVRVVHTLRGVATGLRKLGGNEDGVAWCKARAAQVDTGADRIEALWRTSFLRGLPRQPASEAALLVVLDDPLYARVHRISRRFLSPRFQLGDRQTETMAAVRPSFTLYELWCFLAVSQQLRRLLSECRFVERGLSQLLSLTSSGAGASVCGRGPAGELTVDFNPTFAGYLSRKNHRWWSISGQRRPDITVTWKPTNKGEPAWLCLDAKYRAGKKNLADAFESVHLYRDALHDSEFGGRCRTACLLAPASSEDTAVWFSDSFRAEFDTGIFQLTPGIMGSSTGELALGRWIADTLME